MSEGLVCIERDTEEMKSLSHTFIFLRYLQSLLGIYIECPYINLKYAIENCLIIFKWYAKKHLVLTRIHESIKYERDTLIVRMTVLWKFCAGLQTNVWIDDCFYYTKVLKALNFYVIYSDMISYAYFFS